MFWIIFLIFFMMIILFFQNKGVPAFLYHQVNESVNITPELFEKHIKILLSKGMTPITISEYIDGISVKNPVLITFDDGYYDNYKNLFPILKKYNIKVSIFLNTFYIQDKVKDRKYFEFDKLANLNAIKKYLTTGEASSDQYMSWEEIKEMHDSGLVDFQAHSHKHIAVYKDTKLEGIIDANYDDYNDLFHYGNIKEGYPLFKKRGEYTIQAINVDRAFLEMFRQYYLNCLKGKSKKEIIDLGQKFINNNLKYFYKESVDEFEIRVKSEYSKNISLIEHHLNKKVRFFCWPWGHSSKIASMLLKKLGAEALVSTKKGTNYIVPDLSNIRRIELRKFTPLKFKLNLFIARNYFLGKIYEFLS